MAFNQSPGVYNRIVDQSQVVSGSGPMAAGIVISANKGPTTVKLISSAREFVDTYGVPSRDNPSMWAAFRFLQRAGFLNVLRVINNATIASGTAVRSAATELTVNAANAGAWGNDIKVVFTTVANAPVGVFGLNVELSGEVVESFLVSRDINAKNGFGRSMYIEDVINGKSKYIVVDDSPNAEDDYMAASVTLTGGTNDTVAPTEGMIVAGWDNFANAEEVDARLLINAGFATTGVAAKMVAIADARRDAYAILDVPQDANSDAQDMVDYRDEIAIDNYSGGLYGGWLKVLDQFSGATIEVPASGDVAANFVRGVANANIWDAVMGLELGSITNTLGTTKNFSEAERDLLYSNGVNPVTKIGVNSAVIWGQKSLQSFASGLDRANVVMNVKDIDVSLAAALLPFVGKPNTAAYRDSANYIVTRFLETRQRLGGLYDFAVDTSDALNTPQVIDNQQFLIDVFIQPVKAMEFIRLTLTVTPTGVSAG